MIAGKKQQKLFDEKGMYLLLTALTDGATAKRWRFKYYFEGTEKLLSLGKYPATSLALARKKPKLRRVGC